jgi:hypothetical protein
MSAGDYGFGCDVEQAKKWADGVLHRIHALLPPGGATATVGVALCALMMAACKIASVGTPGFRFVSLPPWLEDVILLAGFPPALGVVYTTLSCTDVVLARCFVGRLLAAGQDDLALSAFEACRDVWRSPWDCETAGHLLQTFSDVDHAASERVVKGVPLTAALQHVCCKVVETIETSTGAKESLTVLGQLQRISTSIGVSLIENARLLPRNIPT